MKGRLTLKKSAVIAAMCLAVLCLPGYSDPTPEQIAERTRLLYEAVKNDDLEWVKLCIKWGADVNGRFGNGATALMSARSKDVVEILVKSGADVNAKTLNGLTALMYAVAPEKERKDVVEMLIKSGADVNAKNDYGTTVLMYASGAVLYTNQFKRSADVVKMLIKSGADVNAKNDRGNTAFSFAADGDAGRVEGGIREMLRAARAK